MCTEHKYKNVEMEEREKFCKKSFMLTQYYQLKICFSFIPDSLRHNSKLSIGDDWDCKAAAKH